MAATLIEFQPMRGEWADISRALAGIEAAVELVQVLRAGRRPQFDPDGVMIGSWGGESVLYLCEEGRDLLRSIEAYLLWRHAGLCRVLGSHVHGEGLPEGA